MSDPGRVTMRREGAQAHVTIDRPAALNAMTAEMYDALSDICDRLASDTEVRVVTVRSAGDRAFVAGTDIRHFETFDGAEDGLAYEREIDRHMARLAALPMPTLAIIDGIAVGGGLGIAACCDIRIAADTATFGLPIARTLGNCLSMQSYARVLAGFGPGRAARMLLAAELLTADEALAAGFLARVCPPGELEAEAARMTSRLAAGAPVSQRVSKAAMARIATGRTDGDDLVAEAYGSEDFRRGVRAFLAKQRPTWTGR